MLPGYNCTFFANFYKFEIPVQFYSFWCFLKLVFGFVGFEVEAKPITHVSRFHIFCSNLDYALYFIQVT